MVGLWEELKSNVIFFVFTFEEQVKAQQLDWFLIIESYHLISKNQNKNVLLFHCIDISKFMRDFNAQWHIFSEL